mmetsp:Transcript_35778/g.89089  ORF Transcript_35778/g.89089 Transcript_35778/m.89089 type:complete len:259 (-) Transcript_35778:345-1121(-)
MSYVAVHAVDGLDDHPDDPLAPVPRQVFLDHPLGVLVVVMLEVHHLAAAQLQPRPQTRVRSAVHKQQVAFAGHSDDAAHAGEKTRRHNQTALPSEECREFRFQLAQDVRVAAQHTGTVVARGVLPGGRDGGLLHALVSEEIQIAVGRHDVSLCAADRDGLVLDVPHLPHEGPRVAEVALQIQVALHLRLARPNRHVERVLDHQHRHVVERAGDLPETPHQQQQSDLLGRCPHQPRGGCDDGGDLGGDTEELTEEVLYG